MANELDITQLQNREHLGPEKTGDNISAKRAAMYGWYNNGSEWVRIAVDSSGNLGITADVSQNLTEVGGSPIALGQTTMSASLPVTIASDQALAATVSGTITSNTTNTNLYTGQTTVNTSQVQLTSSSHALVNGLRLKAPSSNSAAIFFGLTGVTTSTGDELEPGESVVLPVNNTNLLYIISAASSSDIITWSSN